MRPAKELRRVDAALKNYPVPDDVYIGKNETADKVEWLIRRLKMTETTLEYR